MAAIFLIFGFMAQVLTPGESVCVGFINETTLPLNVYVVGMEEEGFHFLATQGSLVYLNGPGVSALRKSESYRIVRAEGEIKDPARKHTAGLYYNQIGIARVESPGSEVATAVVTTACQPIAKGDLLVPLKPIISVTYNGNLTDRSTPFEAGLTSTILLGQDDLRLLGTGHYCFIGLGTLEGVKPGDHFAVYRPQPPFDPFYMTAPRAMSASYDSVEGGDYNTRIVQLMEERKLPPRPLGDVVVVEAGNHTSTVKVINALYEMRPGDIVVKR
jgi:hypothetical protein